MRFTPLLALLTSLLVPLHALAGWFGKDGPPLTVERHVSQTRDWNTGQLRDEVTFTLRVNGRKLSEEKLGAALGATEDAVVWDALSAGPSDALVVYRSGEKLELASLHVEGGDLKGKVLVRDLSQSWFTDARLPGWVSVQQENHLHLVQLSPLRVVDVGPGVLLDVRGDVALLAEDGYHGPASTVHAVSLSQAKQVATLALPTACFVLPTFEFTHPLVYAGIDASTPEALRFQDGPDWFDAHFEWLATPTAQLRLKPTQKLPRPALERWYVDVRQPDLGRPPRKLEETGYAGTPTIDDHLDTVEVEPAACQSNPNPRLNAGKEPYPTHAVMAEDLCLDETLPGITSAMRQARCVLPATTTVLSKGPTWQLEALHFTYRPQNGKPPVAQTVYQLRSGAKVHRAIAGSGGENLRLREVLPIGDGQALIKARGDGAYELFRLSSDATGTLRLDFLETIAYPATPFDTSKPGWVYLRSGGVLVKTQPFGSERVGKGLLDIRGNELLFQYVNDDALVLQTKPFQREDDSQRAAGNAPRLQLSAACRPDDDPYWEFTVPPVNATLAESAAWFSRHFSYVDGKPGSISLRQDHQLRVKQGCIPDSK